MAKKPSGPDIIKMTREIDRKRRIEPGSTIGEALREGSESYVATVVALREWIASRDPRAMGLDDARFLVVTMREMAGAMAEIGQIDPALTALPGDDAKIVNGAALPPSPIALVTAQIEAQRRTKQ